MKKLILVIIGLFVAYYISNIWKQNLGNGYKYVDAGYDYWQSIFSGEEEIIPIKVVEYHSNEKYILAVRVIMEIYECYEKNVITLISANSSYNDTINRKKLQYWLIDKTKKIRYISKDKSKIEQKIKTFNASLSFDNDDYKNNSYMKGVKDELNPKYKCIPTNDPLQNNIKIINLDANTTKKNYPNSKTR